MRETRGRLKIFLGAAPGVGKTYEMLVSAQAKRRRRRRRRDRRRRDPRPRRDRRRWCAASRSSRAAGSTTRAGCSRRWISTPSSPAARDSSLVDELAHTNAPGSRHPKRYLDVEELLAAGIDVYTTVNIQHVESLNDVVAQITRIRVRETVPDSIIDRADDIEVIDITPDDLIQRLKDGKVYVRETAGRALDALLLARQPHRAARTRAPRHRPAGRRPAPHPHAGQRHRRPLGRRRAGARLHQRAPERRRPRALRQAPGRPAARPLDRARSRDARAAPSCRRSSATGIADTLRLAERLGGEALTLPGGEQRSPRTCSPHAQAQNVTQIVIGKSTRSRWFELLHGSVVHDLVRLSGGISVHVIAGDDGRGRADPVKDRAHAARRAGASTRSLTLSRCSPSLPPSASSSSSSRWSGSSRSTSSS